VNDTTDTTETFKAILDETLVRCVAKDNEGDIDVFYFRRRDLGHDIYNSDLKAILEREWVPYRFEILKHESTTKRYALLVPGVNGWKVFHAYETAEGMQRHYRAMTNTDLTDSDIL
jgi:hypothetical protein